MNLKLQQYSALAAAFLAARMESDAQVIYTDIKDDTLSKANPEYLLDLNNDGITDFKIDLENLSLYVHHVSMLYTDNVHITPYGNNSVATSNGNALALACSDTIDDRLTWQNEKNLMAFYIIYWQCSSSILHSCFPYDIDIRSSGAWPRVHDHYLALKLVENGSTYYGWARLDLNIITPHSEAMQCIIKDFAVQKKVNEPAITGSLKCADLKAVIPPGPYVACAPACTNFQLNLPPCYSFQWYKNDTAIAGATSNEYSVCDSLGDAASYDVIVNDNNGCITTSNKVSKTIFPALSKPSIAQQGDTLSSTASDQYQWYYHHDPIAGATEQIYIPFQNGSYEVGITNADGCSSLSDTFNFASCKLYNKTVYVINDADSTADSIITCSGVPVQVKVEDAAQEYEWVKNDSVIASGVSLANFSIHEAGNYHCNLIGWGDTCKTKSINVTVMDRPFITQKNDTLISSSSISNQWFQDGSVIAGATNQTYIATEAGSYFVEVTGDVSCTLSSDTIEITITHAENIGNEIYPVISYVNSKVIQVRFLNSDFLRGRIKVMNALGQQVREVIIAKNIMQIPFSENESGWFVIDIEKDQHRFYSPIIIF